MTTPSGTSTTGSADHFTASALFAPTVSSLGTTSGSTAGGTALTITGTNFTGASAILFGTVPATTFTVNSATLITVVAPPHTTATVYVTVTTSGGTSPPASSDRFTFTQASAPTVTSLDTTSGSTSGGTVLTVTGTNFTGATNVTAPWRRPRSPWFPVRKSLDIIVTTGTGTSANSSDQFTYSAASAPAVTSIAPTSGTTAGGTVITITGSNFTHRFRRQHANRHSHRPGHGLGGRRDAGHGQRRSLVRWPSPEPVEEVPA